ncbi:MAG: [FeFe] hydrogenase H-cluster maturation GTPase HydF [Lachnospiraceae bacterium]|nr:[FeFe] hydrogenase H-cluster maturation GTPase HydF [Lachnospiraceae bacterium]
MSLNDTSSAQRIKISFLGCTNAGKSSLVNAVTGQEVALVSEVKGTTTDPVGKSMEILPLGPVILYDTPGFDDKSELGEKRVARTKRTMTNTDIGVVVIDSSVGITLADEELIRTLIGIKIPFITVFNKEDLCNGEDRVTLGKKLDEISSLMDIKPIPRVFVSATSMRGVAELRIALSELLPDVKKDAKIIIDLLKPGDVAVLVCPIDESAPKDRLILPQTHTIRELIEYGVSAVVTTEKALKDTLDSLKNAPTIVITDSQALMQIKDIVPDEVPLTTFSILMARYKGFLNEAAIGINAAKDLAGNAKILVCEGCTHHRQCNDIGTVKLPKAIKKLTGKDFNYEYTSGQGFPEDLSSYSMLIHCGACMVSDKEVAYRLGKAKEYNIPFTNYGITLAMASGTLERTLRIFPALHDAIFG